MRFKLPGSVNFLSNLILRLQLSSSGLRWVGQIGTGSKYNKKMKPERKHRASLPFHLAWRSAWREIPCVSMWCWSCAVWFGQEGRKHLLTEREPEARVFGLFVCVLECACPRVSALNPSVPSLLYPADLAMAHFPQGPRHRRLAASCSIHTCVDNTYTKLGRKTKVYKWAQACM